MRRSFVPRALALLMLSLVLATCAPPSTTPRVAGCLLTRRAEVPLRSARNFMLATVSLDGRAASLIVDTGAEATTLTPATVARLKLPPEARGSVLRGVSGSVHSANARLHHLALNGMLLSSNMSVGVSDIPPFPGVQPPVAGLLGVDVLSHFEVELDLPAHRMALYTLAGCSSYAPWPGASTFALQRTATGLTFIGAQVDGRTVRALLDTGARTTMLTRQTAMALGVSAETLAGATTRNGVGIGSGSLVFRQHRFDELGLPGDLERDMSVNIAELDLPDIDMLLGADYLEPRHTWISYATGRLFIR